MTISQLLIDPYTWGILAILGLYAISGVTTRNINPFALACGVDNNISASLLQFLVFTYLTVYAYVAVYVARLNSGLTTLPNIPLNLLVLMGLSVATATASKGIVVSYIDQGKLPLATDDQGGVVKDKNGNIALTKVQMLTWTFIAAGIYFATVQNFIANQVYIQPNQTALPDVDGALLVLMGAAQGGYIGGKLVSQTTSPPLIERILPSPVTVSKPEKIVIQGGPFGDSPDGSTVVYRNTNTGDEREVPAIPAAQWKDSRLEFDMPPEMKTPGSYTIWISAKGQMSKPYDLRVIA